jgi:TetR/AcrR family transcriptional regulator, tetracycline repressor protein
MGSRMSRREDAAGGGSGGDFRRAPGQRAGLRRDAVVASARRLAEAEGVERVTMRRLGAELGVAPNALYTHFPDKTAILDALFDDILGELEPPDAMEGAWQEALAELMRTSRRLLLRHARLVNLFLTRPGGRNALRLGEVTLQILGRGGIRDHEAVSALRAVLTYTLGFVALEVPRTAEPERGERVERAAGLIEKLPVESYPLTRAVGPELASHPGDEDFERGLRWLIEGIAGDSPPV